MVNLEKQLKKLEKEYNHNPLATIRNSKILKRAAKLQTKIDNAKKEILHGNFRKSN